MVTIWLCGCLVLCECGLCGVCVRSVTLVIHFMMLTLFGKIGCALGCLTFGWLLRCV